MIIAAVVVASLALGVSATALLGRARPAQGIAGQFALALPFVAVCSAVGLHNGMGLAVALIAALSVALAVVIPAFLPEAGLTDENGVGRAAASWVSGFLATLIMAALLLSWTASIIQFATPLNRNVVVIVLAIAATAAARGTGAARVWGMI
ncbi:MAG: hypothetical protein WCI74_13310, partial [Actinomycetes bacterium]